MESIACLYLCLMNIGNESVRLKLGTETKTMMFRNHLPIQVAIWVVHYSFKSTPKHIVILSWFSVYIYMYMMRVCVYIYYLIIGLSYVYILNKIHEKLDNSATDSFI